MVMVIDAAAIHATSDSFRALQASGLIAIAIVVLGAATLIAVLVLTRRADPTRARGAVAPAHSLTFPVGQREIHRVSFRFDQTWGWVTIEVDGVVVVKTLVTVSVGLVRTYDLTVGTDEVHHVRIEKTRPLFYSFARPQPLRAFVDGVLVAENDGRTRS